MSESLRFLFELDAVDEVVPWGEPGQERLHWFGLTSGRYWIETNAGEVLTYTAEAQQLWNLASSHVDYQVARWLEDLEGCLPKILEPVPEDIAEIVCDSDWLRRAAVWREEQSSDWEFRWDLYDAAVRWWHDREIDTAYLRHGPILSFWRIGERVHLRWKVEDNHEGTTPVFSLSSGHCEVAVRQFQDMAYGFCERVLSAMRQRVEGICHTGWQRTDCKLEINELVAEQAQREGVLNKLRIQSPRTNWDEVRVNLGWLRERLNR
jgi:hypothetical protein